METEVKLQDQGNPEIEKNLAAALAGGDEGTVEPKGKEPEGGEQEGGEPSGGEAGGKPAGEPAGKSEGEQKGDQGGAQEPSADWKPNPVWDILKTKLSTEENPYELPEHILKGIKPDGTPLTAEEEFNELVNHIANNIEIEDDDPFISNYKAARQKEDFNVDEFVKSYKSQTNIMSLPAKDFMSEFMKLQSEVEKRGWTEEDISTFLEGKNKIELDQMADQAKVVYQKYLSQKGNEQQKASMKEASEKRAQRIKDINTQNLSRADKLAQEMIKKQTIGGIPHGQSDMEEFLPIFKEMVSLDPETGAPKVREVFKNDETLYEVLYLYNKLQKGALTDIKEKAKKEVLDKTGLQRRVEGGSQRTVKTPTPEDFVS